MALVPEPVTAGVVYCDLKSYLRGNLTTMEENLSKMVEINSYFRNIEGVNSLGRWVSNQLSPLGFQRQVVPRAEYGNNIYFTNHGNDKNDLLIVGNLDNQFHYKDFTPFYEERGRIYGTGVSVGKGGLAVLIGALRSLRYTRSLKKIRCGILLITDESAGGGSSKSLIEDVARKSCAVIGLHGAGLAGELVASFSGILRYNVEINYIQGKNRVKLNVDRIDPVAFVTEKIGSLKKLNDKEKGIHVIVTSLQTKVGGDLPPDYASLSFLIHYPLLALRDELDKKVYRLFEVPSKRPVKVHITKGPQKYPLLESDHDIKFFEEVEKIAKKIEVRVNKTHSEISSSLSYVPQEIPTLEGFGPVTGSVGTQNEFVIRDSLIDRAVLLANVISKSREEYFL